MGSVTRSSAFFFLAFYLSQLSFTCVYALFTGIPATTATTTSPLSARVSGQHSYQRREERAITSELSTCGYLDGDPLKVRTANSGYNCRVDARNGLWGFCAATVEALSDCPMAGACLDAFRCSSGCYNTDQALDTISCQSSLHCSLALLTFGIDQTYSYIACDHRSITEHYYITPTLGSITVSSGTSEPTTSEPTSTPTISLERTSTTTSPSSAAESTGGTLDRTTSSSGGSSSHTGAIIGGVIGGLAVVGITLVAVIYLRNRGSKARSSEPSVPQVVPYEEAKPPEEEAAVQVVELPVSHEMPARMP